MYALVKVIMFILSRRIQPVGRDNRDRSKFRHSLNMYNMVKIFLYRRFPDQMDRG